MKLTFVVLVALLLVSCSHGPQALPFGGLTHFAVTVDKRSADYAIIHWDEVTTTRPGDTVRYKVQLNNRVIHTGIEWLADTLLNLKEDSAYNGRVYAYTKSGDTVSAPFTLDRLQGYIYMGDEGGHMYCMDLYSEWDRTIWASSFSPGNGQFLGEPTIVNGVLYANGSDNSTWAINAKTGEKIWSTIFERDNGFIFGNSINPLYANDRVYTIMPKAMYALNAKTGSVVWKYATTEAYNINPVLAGNLLIAASNIYSSHTTITAVNVETGKKAWELGLETSICPNPVVYNGFVIFGAADGKVYALNSADGTQAWEKQFAGGANVISPITYNNIVIAHSTAGGYYALSATSGETIWSSLFSITTPGISSPATGNGKLYFTYDDYPTTGVTALDIMTGQVVWKAQLTLIESPATPIFAKNRLYIGHNIVYGYGVVVLDANNGQLITVKAQSIYQWGKETIVENDSTYYLPQSGMVQ